MSNKPIKRGEMESGELGTVDEIKTEMKSQLVDYYASRVFASLTSVWTASNTPENYTDAGGPLTATALKNAIDFINQRVGRVKAVVGSRKALTPVTTFGAGWSLGTGNDWAIDSALQEIYQTGWLGKYYGANIIALDQVYNNLIDYAPMIPEDKVLVIGDNVGEFITYGEPKEKAWDDMNFTPPQFFVELYQLWGLIIDKAMGIAVIKVS